MSALYKNRDLVPKTISDLFKSQSSNKHWELEDYETMSHALMLKKLERIVRTSYHSQNYPPYAVTSDNFLKMSLIVSTSYAP